MMPDEFQRAWQGDQPRVTFDPDALQEEVRRLRCSFQSTIYWRDFREIAVSVVMTPVWIILGLALSLPWTWYLTIPAYLWVAGFMLVDRRRHPQRPSEPGKPLLEHVQESQKQVEHQIWLLRNIFWWYLLPFYLSVSAFFIHVAWRSSDAWWQFIGAATFFLVFVAAMYGWIFRLNQRAASEVLEPRRRELLKLAESLQGETTADDSGDMLQSLSRLADADADLQGAWAENWNRLIPSWRVAFAIAALTFGAALGGWFSPIKSLGPAFFQAVVAAVLALEISLVFAWRRSQKQQSETASADAEKVGPGAEGESADGAKASPWLRGPAIMVIAMFLVLSTLAVIAFCRFMASTAGASGLKDVSAFSATDVEHLDA